MAAPLPPSTDPAVLDLQKRILVAQQQLTAQLKELRINLAAIRRAVPFDMYRSPVLGPIPDQTTDETSVLPTS